MNIALKEARETNYWLRLLVATEENIKQRLLPILDESNQLIAILHTIIKNTKSKTK
jgi:four helix bundle protein